MEGPANGEPIKAGKPIEIPDLKGTYKPGGAAGGSGGGLAGTGSEDHATLKALALAAGTITLVGTALLTFLPGRRRP